MLKWMPATIQQRVVGYYIKQARTRLKQLPCNVLNNRELLRCLNDVIRAYRCWDYLNPKYEGPGSYYINTRCMRIEDLVWWAPQHQFRRVELTRWLNAPASLGNLLKVLYRLRYSLEFANLILLERQPPPPRWFHDSLTGTIHPRTDISTKGITIKFYYRMADDRKRVHEEIPFLLGQLLSILTTHIDKKRTMRLLWPKH